MAIFGLGKGMDDGKYDASSCEGIPTHLGATGFGFLNFAGTLSGGIIAAAAGALKSILGLGAPSAFAAAFFSSPVCSWREFK